MSEKTSFAHSEPFEAPAVSGKAGFAHGEPFGVPAVSKKGGFAHGRTEIRAITGRISAAPAEGSAATDRGARPERSTGRHAPGGSCGSSGGGQDIPNSESEGCASAPRRRCGHVCAANHAGARSRGVRGWAPVYKEERLGDVCHRASRRTAATYSPTWWGSTIGVSGLNFSVRDGKRWFPAAKATAVYVLKEIT